MIELLLIGPRCVMDAGRGWRQRTAPGPVDRARAAAVLQELLRHEQGISPALLLGEVADAAATGFDPALPEPLRLDRPVQQCQARLGY